MRNLFGDAWVVDLSKNTNARRAQAIKALLVWGERGWAVSHVRVGATKRAVELRWRGVRGYNSAYSWVKRSLGGLGSIAWTLNLKAGARARVVVGAVGKRSSSGATQQRASMGASAASNRDAVPHEPDAGATPMATLLSGGPKRLRLRTKTPPPHGVLSQLAESAAASAALRSARATAAANPRTLPSTSVASGSVAPLGVFAMSRHTSGTLSSPTTVQRPVLQGKRLPEARSHNMGLLLVVCERLNVSECARTYPLRAVRAGCVHVGLRELFSNRLGLLGHKARHASAQLKL